MARKENSHWPCLSHVVLCVVRECGQLGLNQKSKVLLEEEGGPVGQTEDVFSTMLGGASSSLPPALVCLGILAPHSTNLPAPYFLADLALALVSELWASLVAWLVKNLPAVRESWVRSMGWEDPLEKGKATHSSILAWRIPWTV